MAGNERNIPATAIPEPHYQCAGYEVFNVGANADSHPMRYDEGFLKAGDLFWVTLDDRESGESCTDFFCKQCVESLGKKIGGKRPLAQVIREKAQDALDEAGKKMIGMLHAG